MTHDPRYLATAIEAALAAGRIQRRHFRALESIEKKGPIDLVTAADLEVEREFRALIQSRFPRHEILGEEGGEAPTSAPSTFRWIPARSIYFDDPDGHLLELIAKSR